MEEKTKINSYQINYWCDDCHDGKMISTGQTLLIHPPRYMHECEKCGTKKNFKKKYPHLHHETENGEKVDENIIK